MPLLGRWRRLNRREEPAARALDFAPGKALAPTTAAGLPPWGLKPAKSWLESCGNPGCRSGWLHLLRSRMAPVFEGAWSCSPECTRVLVASAMRAELSDRIDPPTPHRHRIPLGLLMLEQGWINPAQLRQAVRAQKSSGGGRLGHWLVMQRAASERLVTRALGLQWSCPVFALEFHDAEGLAALAPRLFLDAFGALPLRLGGDRILYLGFEERLDPVLALAIERMTGLRVECGLVESAAFQPAHLRMLRASFPAVELIEASSEPAAVQALTRRIERLRPVEARLARVHDCLWLRLWRRSQRGPLPECGQVQDILCSLGSH